MSCVPSFSLLAVGYLDSLLLMNQSFLSLVAEIQQMEQYPGCGLSVIRAPGVAPFLKKQSSSVGAVLCSHPRCGKLAGVFSQLCLNLGEWALRLKVFQASCHIYGRPVHSVEVSDLFVLHWLFSIKLLYIRLARLSSGLLFIC